MKFNLNPSIQLTDEKNMACRRIDSSLLYFEEQAPIILQGDTLEGYKLYTNSFPIAELDFEYSIFLRWRKSSLLKMMRMEKEHWLQKMKGQNKDLVFFQ